MSIVSPPKGGADVQDALIATQRKPDYQFDKKDVKPRKVDNLSEYVVNNLRKVDKPRHGEHR